MVMKTYIFTSTLIMMLFASISFGQDVTTVTATNYDISDNLDLTAVASIFGESKDLADFEYRLNNPKTQISNLDLNRDGYVDYLRVIESVEKTTHLVVIQSVLGNDLYQDVATIEVEKDPRHNTLQVQVVGDVFLYGNNYIYEPIYYNRPIIFNTFWTRNYVVYHSPWHWGYYPAYYSYWRPFPVFRYRTHVHTYVNVYNTYNYVNTRRSTRAVAMHNSVRSNYYERQNPNQSFTKRNDGYRNSFVMSQSRSNASTNNVNTTRASKVSLRNSTNTTNAMRSNTTVENTTRNTNITRGNSAQTTIPNRGISVNQLNTTTRSNTVRSTNSTRNQAVQQPTTPARNSSVGNLNNSNKSQSIRNTNSSTRSSSINNTNSNRSSSVGRTVR